MSSYPLDWKVMTLGEICEKPQYGYTASATLERKGPKFVRITDITGDQIDWSGVPYCECDENMAQKYVLDKDDILFARTGTTGSSVLIKNIPEKAIFASYLIRIKPKKGIEPNYLGHYLKSSLYWKQVNQKQVGSIQKGINASVLTSIKAPVPPLVEQRGVAEVLGTVDEAIRRTDAVIAKSEELKRGLMQRLLTRGIGHTRFKQTELGEIPETWKVETLGNSLTLCDYGLSLPLLDQGKYPIIRMNNIEDGLIVENDLKYADLTEKKFNNYRLKKGDILFNRTNSHELVGKVGIYLLDGNHTFASYLIRLRVFDKLNPIFLNYFLNLPKTQSKLKTMATRGVSQSNINATNLKKILIPIPSVNEQERLIEYIQTLDQKIKNEKAQRRLAEELKKGLMKILLTGEVRVRLDEGGLHRIRDD